MHIIDKMHNWSVDHRRYVRDKVLEADTSCQTSYYNYITGKKKPSVSFMFAFAKVLNETGGDKVTVEELRDNKTKFWFNPRNQIRKIDVSELNHQDTILITLKELGNE